MKQLGWVLIGIIMGAVISGLVVTKCSDITTGRVNDTTYVYDTIRYSLFDTIPVPVQVIDSVPYSFYDTILITDTIPIPQPIDTAGIIADYYRLRIYNDVFTDDNLEFHLWQQVGANRIIRQASSYRILKPETIVYRRTNHLYAGVIAYNKGASPVLLYSNDRMYAGGGYDPFGKSVMLTAGINLISW